MLSSIREILSEGKIRWIRFLILLGFSALLVTNSLFIKSSVVGIIASLGLMSLISVAIGEMFYLTEKPFFRYFFGLAIFLFILVVSGFGLMLIGKFTEILSLIVIVIIGVFFGIISLHGKSSQSKNLYESYSRGKTGKRKDLYSYIIILIFICYVAVAFRFLLLARTSEGGNSVWLEISPFFIPVFAIATLILASILFFSSVGDGVKLVLLCVYSFLVHSLFLIVWYPSRYGDPLRILGHARYTARTGTIYAFDVLTSNLLVSGIIQYRAQLALTIFFERMFSIDIYWVHTFIVPLLWSIFVPCLAYKLTDLLIPKRSRVFPLLAALSTGLFPSLILWGAVSVPNSLGFVFFFLSVVLILKWMNNGGKWNWLMALLAVVVTTLTHSQPGLFALMFFFWVNIIHSHLHSVLKIAGSLLTLALYPIALYFDGATFSTTGLFVLDNFLSFQSEITTILLVFGLLGLILGVRGKYVNAKSALMLFGFYIAILFEYYLTEFGMTILSYGAHRILVMGDLLLVPFVALGILAIVDVLRKVVTPSMRAVSLSLSSKKVKLNLKSRSIALALICLFVSMQATTTLYQAYPHEELVPYQPSAYMIEAVEYIDADAPGRYVVMCDPRISTVAIGFLGVDHGWAGGVRGFFGWPEWDYPTIEMYAEMTKQPSISIMRKAMEFGKAVVSYFVVWKIQERRYPSFEEVVKRTSEILPAYRVFGDGKLYVFRYPLPIKEESGPPVKVIFGDGVSTKYVGTNYTYMFETDINSTLMLRGYTSYNITDYPMHWTFLDLTVNNVSRQFDEMSDINTFIYVKGLKTDEVLTVKWRWNRRYQNASWKDDSFKTGWRTHDIYSGNMVPTILTDGNILNMSYSFTPGLYSYYYYIKPVDVDTTNNTFIIVRWRSDGPIAVVAYYIPELGLKSAVGYPVPMCSESKEWTVNIFKPQEKTRVSYIVVGISNLKAGDISGMRTLSVDYILISTST